MPYTVLLSLHSDANASPLDASTIIKCKNARPTPLGHLLLKYHAKALALVPSAKGVGTSANPGLATGCLKYTAAHILWFTSKYRGMKAKALIYSRGCQGVKYGLEGSIGLSFSSSKAALRSLRSRSDSPVVSMVSDSG
jgi:hypothetical protein